MTPLDQRIASATHDEYLVSSTQKKWWVASIKCDEAAMTQLLKETPNLAHWQNYIDGSAMHYAAKAGNTGLIRLLAGNHQVDVNLRNAAVSLLGCQPSSVFNEHTCPGQTPLHLAARGAHRDAIFLLTATYGADPGLYDNNGRIPRAYLPDTDVGVELKKTFKTTRVLLLTGKNKELFSLLATASRGRSRSNSPVQRQPDALFGSNSYVPLHAQFPWRGGLVSTISTVRSGKHFSPVRSSPNESSSRKPVMFCMTSPPEVPKTGTQRMSRLSTTLFQEQPVAPPDPFTEITNRVREKRERTQTKYNPLTSTPLPQEANSKLPVKSKVADKRAILAKKLVLRPQ
ncbi:hypothetical protein CRM22_008730 [Opisthorchis felineus]|uniref:Uncharacterized protein n=1 Tax=Opisthorchis felineus TaxID=147828 RepID=A0A4S2L9Y6_OPIFE|nr:hypothetical protein CRM22_008730 [Opisthorchis felineus]